MTGHNGHNISRDPTNPARPAGQTGHDDLASAGRNVEACVICGAVDDPTVEHIIPRALWNRFGINPDREDLARYRTTLCNRHNEATSVLHERAEMLDFIAGDGPVTKRTVQHLADWAVWVSLLLGLARGEGVLGPAATRALLLRRFDENSGGIPRGFRVYAALVRDYVVRPTSEPDHDKNQYALALIGDDRIALDHRRQPIGYSARTGSIHAAEAIGLGRVALLLVGPTYSSGPDHLTRLDHTAATVGMTRIHPLSNPSPKLEPRAINMTDVSKLFTVIPHGRDMSLTPTVFRLLQPVTDVVAE